MGHRPWSVDLVLVLRLRLFEPVPGLDNSDVSAVHRLRHPGLDSLDGALAVDGARLGVRPEPSQYLVHDLGDVGMHGQPVPALYLHKDVEGGRRSALEDRLLCAAATCLVVSQRDRMHTSDQVGERRIRDEVLEGVPMGRGDQLDAALGDGAGGVGIHLRADLVDYDDLGHVVLDGFDHDRMLEGRCRNLHPPGAAYAAMRDVAVSPDLVRGVDHDNALAGVVGKDSRHLAEHRRLTDARLAKQQHALASQDEVFDDADRAIHRASDPQREADYLPPSVANRGDAMEGSLDARAVVVPEMADAVEDVLDVLLGDLARIEGDGVRGEPGLWLPPEIQNDLQQLFNVISTFKRLSYVGWQLLSQRVEICIDSFLHLGAGTSQSCLADLGLVRPATI